MELRDGTNTARYEQIVDAKPFDLLDIPSMRNQPSSERLGRPDPENLVENSVQGFPAITVSIKEVALYASSVLHTVQWLLSRRWVREGMTEDQAEAALIAAKDQMGASLETLLLHPHFGAHSTDPQREKMHIAHFIEQLHSVGNRGLSALLQKIHAFIFPMLVYYEQTDRVHKQDFWKVKVPRRETPPTFLAEDEKLSPHPVHVREFERQDERQMIALLQDTQNENIRGLILGLRHPDKKLNKTIVAISEAPQSRNAILGVAQLQRLYAWLMLDLIAVHPEFQRRDIGTELLRYIQKNFIDAQHPIMVAQPRESQRNAQYFFRANDFEADGKVRQFATLSNEGAYRMAWRQPVTSGT